MKTITMLKEKQYKEFEGVTVMETKINELQIKPPQKVSKRFKNKTFAKMYKYRHFYLLFMPVFVFTIIFHYIPMYGIKMSFYDWGIFGPNEYVGMANFKYLLTNQKFILAFKNTLEISFFNLLLGMFFSVLFALLLNELTSTIFKKFSQTVLYLPHFLSWVVVASIFAMILSPDGIINKLLANFGQESQYFLISEKWWRPIFYFITRWKETGWGTIIYLAALTGIDPGLYEAASIDGAGRLKQVWHITLPALQNTILIVFILNLSKVLNVFESVFVLINPMVYSVADVIGTYTYRIGLISSDYGYSTAVGLFKSLISMVLVLIANQLSKKIKGEGIL
jgi:putative aldouronate transport system permease protein